MRIWKLNPEDKMKFTIIIALLSTLLLSHAAVDVNADVLRPQVIKLQRFRKALWKINVTVKERSGDFLFDTGGGITLLGGEFSKGIECNFWGRTTGYNMFGKRSDGPHCDDVPLRADGVGLTTVSVGKINFGDQFPGDRAPDGLLSLDAFDGKIITLDQAAATLTIETSKSLMKRIKKMTEVPMRISRECSARCLSVFMGVRTSKGTVWMLLDSGAGGVSLISKDHAGIFGLDADKKEQRVSFKIIGDISVDSPVVVTDMIMDGNLGQPFLCQHVITIDLNRGRLWISKNK